MHADEHLVVGDAGGAIRARRSTSAEPYLSCTIARIVSGGSCLMTDSLRTGGALPPYLVR
jgi:hypothetical protein